MQNSNIKCSIENKAIADREGHISIFVNTLLFILKFWAGTVSGSIALLADAWHTLSDSLSSLILLIGMKKSQQEADCNHPYGHERYELIASLVIGILLSVVAFDFLVDSIRKYFSNQETVFGPIAITVTIVSIVSKELLARYSFWGAKKTGLNVLKAEAWHHRSDAISSLVILIGIFLKAYIPFVDELLGLAVSLLLFHASYEVIRESINPLIGSAPSQELLEQVTEISKKYAGEKSGAHHFHIHEYGNHVELTFHIRLNGELSVTEAHNCVTKIEEEIFQKLNIYTTIHPEPIPELGDA